MKEGVKMPENSSCSGASTCSRESCEGCPSKAKGGSGIAKEPMNKASNVKKVIGVVSGKGGVGKSFVTSSLACAMNKAGYKVGIMDADITGPSIPKMFGVHGQVYGTEDGMVPMAAENGIKIMSVNLLLDNEEDPVIWRGPVIAGVVKQFWNETVWGDIDYLFVDMPPGTGDVPLTVFQSLPVAGIVVVTSPQELVSMIVEKAVNMADMMDIPVLGIVENMSYFECPDCGKKHEIFGKSHIDEIAAEHDIKAVAKLPINPEAASKVDGGFAEDLDVSALDNIFEAIRNC